MTSHVFSHSPVLGTVLTVSVDGSGEGDGGGAGDELARAIDRRVSSEIERLETMLSRHRADSAFERWKRGALDDVPAELAEVLVRAIDWSRLTHGALDPRAGALTQLWRSSATAGRRPTSHEVRSILDSLSRPAFDVDHSGVPHRLGDCDGLDLQAFAKGWIVDRSIDAAMCGDDITLLIAAGGDVARTGPGESVVSIEDPFRPYDNATPIDRVALGRGGLATSGVARRPIEVDGRRVSHIIDPRTGQPAEETASVSVIADSAEAADAWATALSLVSTDEIVDSADAVGVAVFAVLADRSMISNAAWRRHRVAADVR